MFSPGFVSSWADIYYHCFIYIFLISFIAHSFISNLLSYFILDTSYTNSIFVTEENSII